MVDNLDQLTRSRVMAAVRSKNTGPELLIRKALHARGFRYRINVAKLPGKPDIVFPKYHAVIFVHGCFWHGHDCGMFRLPETRQDFWREKIRRNRERDRKMQVVLTEAGWRCLTVWECAIRGPEKRDFGKLIDDVVLWLNAGMVTLEIYGNRRISDYA